MKKPIVILTVSCLLAPGTLNAGIAYAEANETLSKASQTEAEQTLSSSTETSATEENETSKSTAAAAEIETSAASDAAAENVKATEETIEPQAAAFTTEQAEQLQAMLPADTTIRFVDGTLFIELPADTDPSIAQKAYDDLKLNVPVEISAKAAEAEEQTDSYLLGIQVFQNDINTESGNIKKVSDLLDKKIEVVNNDESSDYKAATDGKTFLWKSGLWGNGKYRQNNDGQNRFTVNVDDFQNGYAAAREAYVTELETYLTQIDEKAMEYRGKVVNSTAYKPDAENPNGSILKIIEIALGIFFSGGSSEFEKDAEEVWGYVPTGTGEFQGRETLKTSDLIKTTKKKLISYIGIVYPTIQNIITKRTLQDPRSIGGPEGVFFPETFAEALELNKSLSKATNFFDYQGAIGSSIANRIYHSTSEAVKKALVESGQEGLNKQIAVQLGDKPALTNLKNIKNPYNKGETLSLAHDATYSLSESYILPLKEIAITNAFLNDKNASQGVLSEKALFNQLSKEHADVFTSDAMAKFNAADGSGDAARAMLYQIYQAEFDGVQKAIKDFKENPFEMSEVATFTNPNNQEKINIKDYEVIWNWLHKASQTLMKNGMHAADLKSHEQKDGKVSAIKKTPADQMEAVQAEIDAANGTYPNNQDIIETHKNDLMEIVKNSYMYSYNAEAKRTNTAFAKGAAEFINQATVKDIENYTSLGLDGISNTPSEPLDSDYTGANDLTSSLFIEGDDKFMGGQAFSDGFAKKFETDGLQIVLEVDVDANSEGDLSELKEVIKTDPLTRYAVIEQKNKAEIKVSKPAGWELQDPDKAGQKLDGDTLAIDTTSAEKGEFPYKGEQIMNHQKKVALKYNKLITPEISTFLVNGYSATGTVKVHPDKGQVIQINDPDGKEIAKVPVDQSGRFEISLPKDKVKVGEILTATATLVNTFGTETTSDAKEAAVTEGTLSFDVSTTTGEANSELLWTNRLRQLGTHTLDRDSGNQIKVDVTDNRIEQANWSLGVSASYPQNVPFKLTWGEKVLGEASIEAWKGLGTAEKAFSETEGVKLQSDGPIPLGTYSSKDGNAPTVHWKLTNAEVGN